MMSWINLTKTDLDVAERHDIAFLNWASLAIGDAHSVDVRTIGRARIRYQKVMLYVQL